MRRCLTSSVYGGLNPKSIFRRSRQHPFSSGIWITISASAVTDLVRIDGITSTEKYGQILICNIQRRALECLSPSLESYLRRLLKEMTKMRVWDCSACSYKILTYIENCTDFFFFTNCISMCVCMSFNKSLHFPFF